MNEQRVDLPSVRQLLDGQRDKVDDLDLAIKGVPDSADGGAANSELSFVMTAVLESAGVASDTLRVLYAVANDAVYDLALHDAETSEELEDFAKKALDA